MESFRWDSYFVTGIEEVDEQHLHLVGLINKFGELLAQNELRYEYINQVFKELKEYTIYHFKEEELLMEKVGIDAQFLKKHKAIHQEFISKLLHMEQHVSVDNVASMRHLLEFLTHWLVYHILGIDQNMACQMEAIKSGSSAQQAYLAQDTNQDQATEALLNALNSLFKQVSYRNQELITLNQTLESQVAKRTADLQEANLHLEKLTKTDALTDLANRRYAMSHLNNIWNSLKNTGGELSCLMIDVDYFKQVNDNFGHDAGDKVLITLSKQIQQSLRNDDTVCRLGGDEFLVICENTDYEGAVLVAKTIHKSVSSMFVPFPTGGWHGSISIGVASYQQSMLKVDELIKLADNSLYSAKAAGKNCINIEHHSQLLKI